QTSADTYSCWMQSADDVSYIFPSQIYITVSSGFSTLRCRDRSTVRATGVSLRGALKETAPQFQPIVFNWVSWTFLVFQGWIISRGKAGPQNPEGPRKPRYNNN
ncbi:Hypothetical predicted protein, partial [Scomber scombrus]